jgi:hypothetical protein
MKFLDKQSCIKTYGQHFDSERKNGIKKAYYTWHYQMNMVNCMDTDQQFKQYLQGCKSQNIVVAETIPMSQYLLDRFGFKSGNIIILRHKNDANISSNFDPLAFGFDYMVGSSEWIVFECNYHTSNVETPIFQDDVLSIAKEKGLKVFQYGELKISALNKKNAIKKIKKIHPELDLEKFCEVI